MRRARPALHGHDFEGAGRLAAFADGVHEACCWCGWPADEHPNHRGRRDNPHIIAVEIAAPRRSLWFYGRWTSSAKRIARELRLGQAFASEASP